MNLHLPAGFPSGGTAYLQVQIHESEDASAAASAPLGHYFGLSSVFNLVPNSGIVFSPLTHPGPPVYSTWADGTFPLDSVASGAEGSIEVLAVPEPATLGLAGLGLAAMAAAPKRRLLRFRTGSSG